MQVANRIAIADDGLIAACEQCGQRNRLPYDSLGGSFRCGKCRSEIAPPHEPLEVSDERHFGALVTSSALPVLVDFWAPWCGPCKMVAPELAAVAAEGAGRWLVAKVNTEELPRVAEQHQIAGIPTFIVFRNGVAVARQSGAMPASHIRRLIASAEQRSG